MSKAAAPLSHGHLPVPGLRVLGDDRLARRAAAGDRQAFAVLYQRHHQGLFRYCRAILGNAEDAADALQNTMAAALRALPGERREIRLKPWLYRIAHNESISLLRRRLPHAGLEQAENIAAPRGSDADTRERLRELVTDLQELQDRQRAALVMRELSGLDYAEIGAALQATPAGAKQLVFEARTALHEMAQGRDMSCDSVRQVLSAEDRRKLRGRKVRAHMKACAGCRDFQHLMSVRERDLAALAPPLPAAAAAGLLSALFGGGHGGGTGGLAGLFAGGAGKGVAGSAAAKGIATVAVVASVGAGTAGVTGNLPRIRGDQPTPPATRFDASDAPAGATPTARPASPGRSNAVAAPRRRGRNPHPGLPRGAARGHNKARAGHPGARPDHPQRPVRAQRRPNRPEKARPTPGAGRHGDRPPKKTHKDPTPPRKPPAPPGRSG
jgi:RNA polymerase sigma factor (sigma-70 family)